MLVDIYSSSDEESTAFDSGYSAEAQWRSFWDSEEAASLLKAFHADASIVERHLKVTFVLQILAAEILYHESVNASYYAESKKRIRDFNYPPLESVSLWLQKSFLGVAQELLRDASLSLEEVSRFIPISLVAGLYQRRDFRYFLRNIEMLSRFPKDDGPSQKISARRMDDLMPSLLENMLTLFNVRGKVELFSMKPEKRTLLMTLISHLEKERTKALCVRYQFRISNKVGMKMPCHKTHLFRWPMRLRVMRRHHQRRVLELSYADPLPGGMHRHVEQRDYRFDTKGTVIKEYVTTHFSSGKVIQSQVTDGFNDYDVLCRDLLRSNASIPRDIACYLDDLLQGHPPSDSKERHLCRKSDLSSFLGGLLQLWFMAEPMKDSSSLILSSLMVKTLKNIYKRVSKEDKGEEPFRVKRILADCWKKMLSSREKETSDTSPKEMISLPDGFSSSYGGGLYAPSMKDFSQASQMLQKYLKPFLPKVISNPLVEPSDDSDLMWQVMVRNTALVITYLKEEGVDLAKEEGISVGSLYALLKEKLFPAFKLISKERDREASASASASASSELTACQNGYIDADKESHAEVIFSGRKGQNDQEAYARGSISCCP